MIPDSIQNVLEKKMWVEKESSLIAVSTPLLQPTVGMMIGSGLHVNLFCSFNMEVKHEGAMMACKP